MLKPSLIFCLIFSLVVSCGYMVYPTYIEYKKTQKEIHKIERSLLNLQRVNETFHKNIHKLKSYPRSIERVAREKFGWCRAGEKIYDFNDYKVINENR